MGIKNVTELAGVYNDLTPDEKKMVIKIFDDPERYSVDEMKQVIASQDLLSSVSPSGDIWFIENSDDIDPTSKSQSYDIYRMPALIFAVYSSDYYTALKLLKSEKYGDFEKMSEIRSIQAFDDNDGEGIKIHNGITYDSFYTFIVRACLQSNSPMNKLLCYRLLKEYDKRAKAGWFNYFCESIAPVLKLLCYIKEKDECLYRRMMSPGLYADYFNITCFGLTKDYSGEVFFLLKKLYYPNCTSEEIIWENCISFIITQLVAENNVDPYIESRKNTLSSRWREITGRNLVFRYGKINLNPIYNMPEPVLDIFGGSNPVCTKDKKITGKLLFFIVKHCYKVIYPADVRDSVFDNVYLINEGRELQVVEGLSKDVVRQCEIDELMPVIELSQHGFAYIHFLEKKQTGRYKLSEFDKCFLS